MRTSQRQIFDLSLRLIGVRLRKEGLVRLRGGQWHPASVLELQRYRDPGDRAGAAERASELRAQWMTLREAAVRLAMEGHVLESGRACFPRAVDLLKEILRMLYRGSWQKSSQSSTWRRGEKLA